MFKVFALQNGSAKPKGSLVPGKSGCLPIAFAGDFPPCRLTAGGCALMTSSLLGESASYPAGQQESRKQELGVGGRHPERGQGHTLPPSEPSSSVALLECSPEQGLTLLCDMRPDHQAWSPEAAPHTHTQSTHAHTSVHTHMHTLTRTCTHRLQDQLEQKNCWIQVAPVHLPQPPTAGLQWAVCTQQP